MGASNTHKKRVLCTCSLPCVYIYAHKNRVPFTLLFLHLTVLYGEDRGTYYVQIIGTDYIQQLTFC